VRSAYQAMTRKEVHLPRNLVQGVNVLQWEDFLTRGSKPVKPMPPKPNDPATIMYTSGTTGRPTRFLNLNLADPAFVAGIGLCSSPLSGSTR
jgi:acyl-coenzyme A synthetase/AMP-(fatty) acid ligase